MNKTKGTRWKSEYCLKYGLKSGPINPDTNIPLNVVCLFCSKWEKERERANKRAKTKNVMHRKPKGGSFRTDHFLSHLKLNHGDKWKVYQQLNKKDKIKFLEIKDIFNRKVKNGLEKKNLYIKREVIDLILKLFKFNKEKFNCLFTDLSYSEAISFESNKENDQNVSSDVDSVSLNTDESANEVTLYKLM